MIKKIVMSSKLTQIVILNETDGKFKDRINDALKTKIQCEKCLILASAREIKRISITSAFRKFPQDLNRNIKKFLIG